MAKIFGSVGIFAGNTGIQKLLHTEVKEKYDKGEIPAEISPFKATKMRRL